MKRIFIFSVLMIAFVMNAVAYEHKIVERHSFRLMHPDDFSFEQAEITWDGNVLDHSTSLRYW